MIMDPSVLDPNTLDQVRLNFNPTGIAIINAAIGLMMLGVALELKLEDFQNVGFPKCSSSFHSQRHLAPSQQSNEHEDLVIGTPCP